MTKVLQFREVANYERNTGRTYDAILGDLFSEDEDKTTSAVKDVLVMSGRKPSAELSKEEVLEAFDTIFVTEKFYE
jgi:hypothetical protein